MLKMNLDSGPKIDVPVPLRRVLITGGAGFIGSHLTRRLLDAGYEVRLLDNLTPQVHGEGAQERETPAGEALARDAELVVGDVRDPAAVQRALIGADAVVHLAARVGVGQSMYALRDYTDQNCVGTAVLLEALIRHPVRKLIVASSMSIYGEGLYRSADGELCEHAQRDAAQLAAHEWEPRGAFGAPLTPLATPEWKRPALASIYALSKYQQERMCLLVGLAYSIPTVALRFFNVYGPGQALSNPYTGALAIFAARLLNGHPPLIFEDGNQRRDFVSVLDVARACELALRRPGADGTTLNIASGAEHTVLELAARLAALLGCEQTVPQVSGRYRTGDIRHCFADVSLAREKLGFNASITLEDGLRGLAGWLERQVADDRVELAMRELEVRGLTR